APGYPAFLALVYVVVGDNRAVVRVLQALDGVAVVVMTYVAGRRLIGPCASVLSALIVAVYPTVVYFGAWLTTEALYLALLTLAMVLVARACEGGQARWSAWGGVATGLAMLVRPQAMLVLPLFGVAIALARWRQSAPRALLLAGLVVACAVATVAPWTTRN